jgi:hypothetical protein
MNFAKKTRENSWLFVKFVAGFSPHRSGKLPGMASRLKNKTADRDSAEEYVLSP